MDKMIRLSWSNCKLYVWFKDDGIKIRYFRNGVDFTNLLGSSASVFEEEIKSLGFSSYSSDSRKEKVIKTLCNAIRNKLDAPRYENIDILENIVDEKEYKKVRKDEILWR